MRGVLFLKYPILKKGDLKMSNCALLNGQEELITFLDSEYLELIEVASSDNIRRLEVKYIINDFKLANELFKQGNKLYVKKDGNLESGLYVINTNVEKDLFLENCVTFTAEDVLVELNNSGLFSQTDLTTANRFKLNKVNGENNVTVNYEALNFWFGKHYNIGIVQDCLTALASRIVPKGTMSLMELYRLIESETGNRFVPRYEKDPTSNVIHRFLDFLNPNDNDKAWNFYYEFQIPTLDGYEPIVIDEEEYESQEFVPDGRPYNLDINNLVLKFVKDGNVITLNNKKLEFNAVDIGISTSKSINQLQISYNGISTISISVNNVTFTRDGKITSQNPTGTYTTIAGDPTRVMGLLPNGTQIILQDKGNNNILFIHEINPIFGDTHNTVLDLGYNVENITIETDETETFASVSPVLSFDNKEYTSKQVDSIITNWKNLTVEKGALIPMVVERVKITTHPQTGNPTNYYSIPQNPQDDMDQGLYDYWCATSYWYAPFSKKKGELSVSLENASEINYDKIYFKKDILDDIKDYCTFKNGLTESSDEDPYNIYNQVCNYLKNHKEPKVTINTDVAELKENKYNDFKLNDKVYLKIPTYDHLIAARVTGTTKNSKNIAENKIELDNYTLNTIIPLVETVINGDAVVFDYPNSGTLNLELLDANDTPITEALISVTVYANNEPVGIAHNVTTNNQGRVNITYKLDPGEYTATVYFPATEYYESSTATFDISVGGYKEESQTTTTSNNSSSSTNKNKYWTKYGRSPKTKKYLIAIGKPWHNKDKGKSNKFYRGVFKNKCPVCGKKQLGYGIFFGKKESSTTGKMPFTKKKQKHADKGVIVCKHCGTEFSCQGHASNKNKSLTSVKSIKESKKATAYNIINGKQVYKLKIKKNKKKKNKKKQTKTVTVLNPNISKTVKEFAKKKVGKAEGLDAIKKLAAFMGTVKYDYYTNFLRSAKTVLNRKAGNCCDQARLFCELCDAVGLTEKFKFEYIYVCCGTCRGHRVGHVFVKVTTKSSGKYRYVDPTCNYAGPYGHYNSRFGRPYSKKTTYPSRPF